MSGDTSRPAYVDDVPYVRQFVAELSPTQLRLAAAVNGFSPPPGVELDYCELGCAHGDTLAALAAAHPEGRFLGVDIGAAHIASAKKLARDGALENIGFLERDFGDLVREDVGAFDFIVAHGVLSWIIPDKRRALIDFAHAKLKPGGILYVSYNAMPGWASVEPLRQLLLSPMGGVNEGTSLERARRGLEFAQSMERSGAEYFAKNPTASTMLRTMTRAGLPYVVHEYLHEHWAPMYFARVAWEMAERDLRFAGVLPLLLNFRDTAIPASLERVFADVTDRVAFESLKDFAINELFRRDLYVKGPAARSSEATSAYLDATTWGSLDSGAALASGDRTVRLPHRTFTLEGPTFDALITALSEGATTIPALAQRRDFGLEGVPVETLRAAILRLLISERVVPMQAPTRAVESPADARYRVPSVYNQMMLRRLAFEQPLLMTSTSAGTALPISALEGLAIRVLTEVAPPERARWIGDFVGQSVLRLRAGDRVIEDQAEQRDAIGEAVDRLCANRLAKLVELGVLTRA